MSLKEDEEIKSLCSMFAKVLKTQSKITRCLGINPKIAYCSGSRKFVTSINVGKQHQYVRAISKLLGITLNKTISTQNFLKWTGKTEDGLIINLNTTMCFYGGEPDITSYPRTRATCKLPKTKKGQVLPQFATYNKEQ